MKKGDFIAFFYFSTLCFCLKSLILNILFNNYRKNVYIHTISYTKLVKQYIIILYDLT